jgi:hypothetical protein
MGQRVEPEKAQIAGRLSVAYIMAVAGDVLRNIPIDMLDLLLVTTVANFNAMPPDERPARRRPARNDGAIAGLSRNALSRAVSVPLETVRRRVAGLIERKVLTEQADGLVFAADNPLGLGNNAAFYAFNIDMLRRLFQGLKANGIDLG